MRRLIETRTSRVFSIGLVCVGLVGISFSLWKSGGAVRASRQRVFVCSETNRSFEHIVAIGETIPIRSPFTGNLTAYEADELCYWTAEGTRKTEPTYVLLNTTLGRNERTFCPDCGRLVVRNNPPPDAHITPPPSRDRLGSQ